jgi:ABC-type branched-subunit amino acid transport system substrate-binding protein
MSTALTGPAADLGLGMRAGVEAALAEANRNGGVGGRKLRLVALDDGYEPSRTAPNMHELVEKHHVLTVIGNVGTPTAIAALPITLEAKTPFFGAYTGAGVLRKSPPDRYVINYRASYAEETSTMVDALIDHAGLDPKDIAFFTQRDGYGDAGFAGGLAALRRRGLPEGASVGHGRYERNTRSVENALADLLQLERPPRAVIMVGAYAPCAAFIRLARQQKFEPLFLNVSFVGTDSLAEALGADGEGVIVTQVVPHYDCDLKVVKEYRRAIRECEPSTQPSFTSLEGYLAARTLLLALGRIEREPTRESVVDALMDLGDFDLGLGETLHLSPKSHQACHRVWPTVIRGAHAVPLQWSELADMKK